MRKRKILIVGIILYIVLLYLPTNVFAAEENRNGIEGFSFEVIQPENQHNKKVSYFDLLMKPGQKQKVQIKLSNSSEREITIMLKLNGAKTNSNGVIEYGPNEIENDASLKYDFIDIVKAPTEIKVAPKSNTMADLNITMPEMPFEGYISGGIQLQIKEEQGIDEKTSSGMVKNKFAYLIGMLLSESEVNGIESELKLNKVYPELQNYRNAIHVNFSNVTPTYVDDMTVSVQLMKENAEKILFETKKSNMRMAPNTMIDFPVSMNGEKMIPGNYRSKISVLTGTGKRWDWEESFEISPEEADKFNEQDVSLIQERKINWRLIIYALCIILALFGIFFILIHLFRKKKKQRKKQTRKKTTKKKIRK